jgi:hypothetical protein
MEKMNRAWPLLFTISQNIVPASHADDLIKKAGGDKSKAYIQWLDNYIQNHIKPVKFRE